MQQRYVRYQIDIPLPEGVDPTDAQKATMPRTTRFFQRIFDSTISGLFDGFEATIVASVVTK